MPSATDGPPDRRPSPAYLSKFKAQKSELSELELENEALRLRQGQLVATVGRPHAAALTAGALGHRRPRPCRVR